MKQGQILNRIVMLVLFGAILVYLGVNVVGSLTDPLITTLSYTYTVDDAVETTGLLVREETVLPAQTLYADILPAEGEKVAKGESIAYLYRALTRWSAAARSRPWPSSWSSWSTPWTRRGMEETAPSSTGRSWTAWWS